MIIAGAHCCLEDLYLLCNFSCSSQAVSAISSDTQPPFHTKHRFLIHPEVSKNIYKVTKQTYSLLMKSKGYTGYHQCERKKKQTRVAPVHLLNSALV